MALRPLDFYTYWLITSHKKPVSERTWREADWKQQQLGVTEKGHKGKIMVACQGLDLGIIE